MHNRIGGLYNFYPPCFIRPTNGDDVIAVDFDARQVAGVNATTGIEVGRAPGLCIGRLMSVTADDSQAAGEAHLAILVATGCDGLPAKDLGLALTPTSPQRWTDDHK